MPIFINFETQQFTGEKSLRFFAVLTCPSLVWNSRNECFSGSQDMKVGIKNWSLQATLWWKLHDPVRICLQSVQACGRQTVTRCRLSLNSAMAQLSAIKMTQRTTKLWRNETATIQYHNWTLLWSYELNASFQLVSFVFSLAPVVLRQQVVEPGKILLRVEIVHQLAYADQRHQLRANKDNVTYCFIHLRHFSPELLVISNTIGQQLVK